MIQHNNNKNTSDFLKENNSQTREIATCAIAHDISKQKDPNDSDFLKESDSQTEEIAICATDQSSPPAPSFIPINLAWQLEKCAEFNLTHSNDLNMIPSVGHAGKPFKLKKCSW